MIVTLCGSVRLGRDVWDQVAEERTLQGDLVFTVNVWDKYEYLHSPEGEKAKRLLDMVHSW